MAGEPILQISPLGAPPWPTSDPFLFCVHHDDAYPAGNPAFGPNASLAGRNIGSDFSGRDGWRMYHGDTVPGFPAHPHRGFETVTVTRQGLIDHADSMGARARYGQGDVQWMTAGRGIVHAEMFPLLDQGGPNPAELFQIWLNLPTRDKMCEPHFTMFWAPNVPRVNAVDAEGRSTEITVIAGALGEARPPAPPPHSWGARDEADLAIWSIRMAPGARWTLPAAAGGGERSLYLFRGGDVRIGGEHVAVKNRIVLRPEASPELVAGAAGAELLLLQGRPIGQPVVAYGPFVMNSRDEIARAYADFQRTQFGGWPWKRRDPVHGSSPERFAVHADGREERAP